MPTSWPNGFAIDSRLFALNFSSIATIVIFCAVGGRASVAKRCLEEMGYKNVSMVFRDQLMNEDVVTHDLTPLETYILPWFHTYLHRYSTLAGYVIWITFSRYMYSAFSSFIRRCLYFLISTP